MFTSFYITFSLFLCCLFFIVVTHKNLNESIQKNEKACQADPRTKILVLIPAHNEELSILKAIKSIKRADYPRGLIHTIVIADRCTDNTEEILKLEKVTVVNNLINENKNKGNLLKSFFEEYKSLCLSFDVVTIFDADVIVDRNFFNTVDYEYTQGHEIVQGEVIPNFNRNNAVSQFMSILQEHVNIYFFDLCKKCNCSVLLQGKGFFVSISVLYELCWREDILVEDVDLSFQALLKGYKINYCKQMKVFCLQPDTLYNMIIQQRRWISGQRQIIKKYRIILLRTTQNHDLLSARYFCVAPYIVLVGSMLLYLVILSNGILNLILGIFSCFVFTLIIFSVSIRVNKLLNLTTYLLVFPLLLWWWNLIFLSCFLAPQKRWITSIR